MTVPTSHHRRHVRPVTVAIATRDRPDALSRCLTAVLSGSALPAEVLIVDQSRTGASRAIVEHIASNAPIAVRHLMQSGDGLSRSRNLAWSSARQAIVAVTDDDCVPGDAWVDVIHSVLAATSGPDAVTGPVLPLGPADPSLFATSTRSGSERLEFDTRIAPWLVGTGANFAARTQSLNDIEGYDERLGAGTRAAAGEDLDLMDRFLKSGRRIRYEPAAVVYHARKPLAERIATRWSYGMGVGALCGLRLRSGDGFGMQVLTRWALMRLGRIGRSLMQGDVAGCREELLMLGGTMAGIAYGLRQAAAPAREPR